MRQEINVVTVLKSTMKFCLHTWSFVRIEENIFLHLFGVFSDRVVCTAQSLITSETASKNKYQIFNHCCLIKVTHFPNAGTSPNRLLWMLENLASSVVPAGQSCEPHVGAVPYQAHWEYWLTKIKDHTNSHRRAERQLPGMRVRWGVERYFLNLSIKNILKMKHWKRRSEPFTIVESRWRINPFLTERWQRQLFILWSFPTVTLRNKCLASPPRLVLVQTNTLAQFKPSYLTPLCFEITNTQDIVYWNLNHHQGYLM